jgi:hypothetical protein
MLLRKQILSSRRYLFRAVQGAGLAGVRTRRAGTTMENGCAALGITGRLRNRDKRSEKT